MVQGEGTRQAIVEFDGLLVNLERQRSLYDSLLTLSEEERVAIGQNNLVELARVIAAKERIVVEAQLLERQRQEACERWARVLDLPAAGWSGATPTLRELRQHAASQDDARRLDAAAIALSERVRRLRQINASNAQLIAQVREVARPILQQALRFVRHQLYDGHGTTAPEQRASIILDYRA